MEGTRMERLWTIFFTIICLAAFRSSSEERESQDRTLSLSSERHTIISSVLEESAVRLRDQVPPDDRQCLSQVPQTSYVHPRPPQVLGHQVQLDEFLPHLLRPPLDGSRCQTSSFRSSTKISRYFSRAPRTL